MKLEPIIEVRLKKFSEQFDLTELDESKVFEYYVNYLVYSLNQSDVFSTNSTLLDTSVIGDGADCGIDGIGIKINDTFIETLDEIKGLVNQKRKLNIEFVFVQAKKKKSISANQVQLFFSGVKDVLLDKKNRIYNQDLEDWKNIIQYILSEDECIILWTESPKVKLYYVSLGEDNNNLDIIGHFENLKGDLLLNNAFDDVSFMIIDSKKLKKLIDNTENNFDIVLQFEYNIPFPEINGVSDSALLYTNSDELMKLLTVEKGMIRKSLFYDNVRAYQGDTAINQEIEKTILEEPEKFILLNNGITLTCDSYTTSNRKLTIRNPQIVNGCQTCNVIFDYYTKNNVTELKMPISIKIIASENDSIINNVVRTTNRQNIVLDEVFEITREFHKDLEQFFLVQNRFSENDKIFYERRSKQYISEDINPRQKINLRNLTKASIAIIFEEPHISFQHEATLLDKFRGIIYKDEHSFYPYYIAAVMHNNLTKKIIEHEKYIKQYKPFIQHLQLIYKLMIAGEMPQLSKENYIDIYFKKIEDSLIDFDQNDIDKLFYFFNQATAKWNASGKRNDSRKQDEQFTKVLKETVLDKKSLLSENRILRTLAGRVIKIKKDKRDNWYGIVSSYPNNHFFFEKTNPNLSFDGLYGQFVKYDLEITHEGKEVAVNVQLWKA